MNYEEPELTLTNLNQPRQMNYEEPELNLTNIYEPRRMNYEEPKLTTLPNQPRQILKPMRRLSRSTLLPTIKNVKLFSNTNNRTVKQHMKRKNRNNKNILNQEGMNTSENSKSSEYGKMYIQIIQPDGKELKSQLNVISYDYVPLASPNYGKYFMYDQVD
jgi:alkylated DNA nucleotide flippase Atl1